MVCPTARLLAQCIAAALSVAMSGPATSADKPAAAHLQAGTEHLPREAALARAAALSDTKRWIEALAIYQHLQAAAPDDDQIYRLRVLTLADLGAAGQAWQLAQARPTLFNEQETRRLANDRIARLAVWGGVTPTSEPRRLEDMRRAELAQAHLGPPLAGATPLRQQLDRIVILNGLEQHEAAAALYHRLRAESAAIPPYALAAAGDSLLAARQPEAAVEALEQAVHALPEDIDTQVVLAYAYLESERQEDALRHLAALTAREPAWPKARNARLGYPNWKRYSAESNLAMVHAYAGDLPAAQATLEPMTRLAPNNADLQAKYGIVLLQRGLEEQALQRLQMAQTLDARNLEARTGQVSALAELDRMAEAREINAALLAQYPDNVHVRRTDEQWRNRAGWQIEIVAGQGRSDGADDALTQSPLGSRDGRQGVHVWSPLLASRWRVGGFGEERWGEFDGPRVRDRRAGIGLRYAHDRLTLQTRVSRSFDDYSRDTSISFDGGWRFSEVLRGHASAETASPDASLQARALGITADAYAVGLDWTPNERSGLSAELRQLRYEDGNRRDSASLSGNHRAISRPRWALDLEGSLASGRGSRDDAPYFNPSRDAAWDFGVALETVGWRRYEHEFVQRFALGIGQYWQEGFGSAPIPSLRYQHRWKLGTGRHIEYGLGWSRPVYDSVRERRITFDIRLRWGE